MKTSPQQPSLPKAITSFFESRRPRAYRTADLRAILAEHKESWALPSSTRVSQLTAMLKEKNAFRQVTLQSEDGQHRNMDRYIWGECTPLEIATTLKESSYLCHGIAVFLHGLTDQIPRTIYINYEQSPKPSPTGPLTQEAIVRAFKGKQRVSRNTFLLDDYRYTILSGKNTGRYAAEEVRGPSGEPIFVTNLERTLVDIVVRPSYSGGLYQVLEAYKTAKERNVSVSRILAALRVLDYRYPYHQSIGFLMEKAGFEERKLRRLRELGTDFDFYLGYGMDNPEFDSSWRVFFPQGL